MKGLRSQRLGIWLLAWLVLVVASTIVRRSASAKPPEGMRVLSLRAVGAAGPAAGEIKLAFVDPAPGSTSMPVILVHGSPSTSHVFPQRSREVLGRWRRERRT